MGTSSSLPSLEQINKTKNLSLKEFQEQTPRKMTIHLLSNDRKDCINFIEFFSNEKIGDSKELLEKDIKKNKFIFFYEL